MRAAVPPARVLLPRAASGVGLAVGAVFVGACADTLIKLTSRSMPIWQLFALRSMLVALALWLFLRRQRVPLQALTDRWVVLRGGLLCVMYVLLYAALPSMTMAAFGAAIYTVPLFVTVFSAVWLKAPVRAAQWAAVAVGFGGVLLVLRPGSDLFSPIALMPVGAAVTYALAGLVTNRHCARTDARVMALSLNLALALLGLLGSLFVLALAPSPQDIARAPALLSGWSPLSPGEGLLVVVLAAMLLALNLCIVRAYQIGPPPLVAVAEYSYIAFVVAWGAIAFDERPDALTVVGLLTLAAAGALAMRGIEPPTQTH